MGKRLGRAAFKATTMAVRRPHKEMKTWDGRLTVIPAKAEIHVWRGEDGFPLSRE